MYIYLISNIPQYSSRPLEHCCTPSQTESLEIHCTEEQANSEMFLQGTETKRNAYKWMAYLNSNTVENTSIQSKQY